MPNLEKQFKAFMDKISLSTSREERLKTSRDSNRTKIEKYFRETLAMKIPTFHMQGSLKMRTIITPIDEEYDLDDGVYLARNAEFITSFTPYNVHDWLHKALDSITSEGTQEKDACVRLVYKDKSDYFRYHVDYPVYVSYFDEDSGETKQFLAHKKKGWVESYPKKIIEWFRNQVKDKEQLIDLCRYIKAWKDYLLSEHKIDIPSGIALTFLVVSNYVADDEDQHSFLETVKQIHSTLSSNFSLKCPVDDNEDLFKDFTKEQKDAFLNAMSDLIKNAQSAINSDFFVYASECWQKVFGKRFPIAEEPKKVAEVIIKSDGRSN